ncbi:MAG: D-aminoacyl-tRNA deacylase [Flavobacteriales bacterium]
MFILVGFEAGDAQKDIDSLARKVIRLRIFSDGIG